MKLAARRALEATCSAETSVDFQTDCTTLHHRRQNSSVRSNTYLFAEYDVEKQASSGKMQNANKFLYNAKLDGDKGQITEKEGHLW
jgi:hypothetical protein